MVRILQTLSLLALILPLSARGEWISVKEGIAAPVPPRIAVLQDDRSTTVVKVELFGFAVNRFVADGKSYQAIDLLTDVATNEAGRPEVPYLAELLIVPDQGDVSVEVMEIGEVRKYQGYALPPARPTWQEGTPEPPFVEDAAAYHSIDAYPDRFVEVNDPVVFRDFRVARVAVYPVRYVPATNELQIATSLTIRLTYGGGTGINPRRPLKRPIAPSFGALYRSTLLNYESVLNREFDGAETGRDVLVIIVPDTFAASYAPYGEWKHKTGTYVKFTRFSEIGANSSNPDIIKNYIVQCYNTWLYPPTYILLGGDYGYVPIKPAPGQSFANEDFFVEIEGNDVFPEAFIGRFTNSSNTEAQTIINKVMKYERTPYRANEDWFKHAVVCANNAYPTQPETKRWVTEVMKVYGGFQVDTLLNPYGGSCIYNLTQVINALNGGRSFLNYRGEGGTAGWWASCYPFSTSDVSSVNNGQMLTFVTSIGCGVANFAAGSGNCFGEQWLELGTPSTGRGACAFIGPTWGYTHTKYNNAIDKGIYVAMFQEGLQTPAQTLLRGKIRMYNLYGPNDPYVPLHFRAYCVLGDPSTHIWRDIPRKVNVSYTPQISVGYDQVHVTVVDSATLAPVSGAEICVASDTVYATGMTDASGLAVIGVTSSTVDTLTITIRGVRVVPVEGTITVIATQEHVAPLGDPTVVDIDGNMDGKINPNEHIQISFVLKNWGTQPSANVQATLAAPDTTYCLVVQAGPVDYGTLPPNGSGSGTGNPMQFYVKPVTPVGTRLTLRLNVTSSTQSWSYITFVDVTGCILEYVSTIVNDNGSSRNNGRLDPGETAILYLTVTNTGQDIAPNVVGTLRSVDPCFTILDSTGSFGTVPIGGTGTSSTDFFVVSVTQTCSLASWHDFTILLSTQNGNYPYSIARNFQLSVGLPSSTDPTGPDAYGYYAYSDDDSLYEQAPKFEWIEIRSVGTRVPYVSPGDFTVTVSLPFTFRYYGRDYASLRISSDGWIAFGSGTQTAYTNYPLPHADNIRNMVAPFWDDLFEGSSNPTSKLLYYHDAPNHRFIVEWDSVGHYGGTSLRESFQVILLDPAYYPTPTGDAEIIFQYRIVGEEGSCTVGIEDSTQTIGLQYFYNSTYDPSASEIRDGSAIKWTTRPPTVVSTNISVAIPLRGGWNLVSNPVLLPDTLIGVRQLFPNSLYDYAFQFIPGMGYHQTATMPNGDGFWAKFPGDELNYIIGARISTDSIPVSYGWNLIGSISTSVDTSRITTIPPGIRTSNYFAYSAGYSPAAQIIPGQGYWVKSSGAGYFVLDTSTSVIPVRKIQSGETGLEELCSITIADNDGGSQTLYFGPNTKNVFPESMFEMPPLPPLGAFDARFESAEGGTMLKTYPEETEKVMEFPISIQSTSYPLMVTWHIAGGGMYELTDATGGRVVGKTLTGKGSLKITNEDVRALILRVIGSHGLPAEYSLSQNYPNPFNPTTTITYALPVESRVSIKIFNVLGQEVYSLVDEVQSGGYKLVEWDLQKSHIASGVYFIRMKADGVDGRKFTAIRKALLIK